MDFKELVGEVAWKADVHDTQARAAIWAIESALKIDLFAIAAENESLCAQLKTVLDREAATHARHDQRVAELDSRIRAYEVRDVQLMANVLEIMREFAALKKTMGL